MFDHLKAAEDHDGLEDHHVEQVRDKFVRAPFGWTGGKSESVRYLIAALPVRKTFNEVCGGSGVVGLNYRPCDLQVFNDRHSGITAFYRCLRDKRRELVERLQLTIHSREEFLWSRDSWENCDDDVERAARWYYTTRMSFSQLGRNFARATSGKAAHPQLIDNSLELFPAIHDRIKKWQIENLDCIQCLTDYDSDSTVHYVDPDYWGTTPGIYKHTVDHVRLLERIHSLKGYVALSGYANPYYDSFKWSDRITWKVPVTAIARAFTATNHLIGREVQMERREAEEVLWIKY